MAQAVQWLNQKTMVVRVQELTGSVTKSIRITSDGEFKNGKTKYVAEFLNPLGETIHKGVCAKREFTNDKGKAMTYFKFAPPVPKIEVEVIE
ncbi:hypothetical protein PAPYR_7534 [Paratrimastix pyriformis]|uniref:Uncharacterized protein n=1 Tax=Paratrimastix pyriformis TaxID=342808 RepID=A0ABQ8UF79_9EUKA|nr:hypothetical protein PAPYR_13029 [Paratrimastix pyriformis]KAJ4453106.1 hypothetical protein PAPYR_12511 [Paratrimastix pyriformis]KAJ4453451.1 hypothetical protein PAPYR_12083 [Paratrimastix pyriformis]KAJ4457027.1 hypothetical protein PAPYR_7534 [Paratrimastix pyriformis]